MLDEAVLFGEALFEYSRIRRGSWPGRSGKSDFALTGLVHCRVHRTWHHVLAGWILDFFSHLASEQGYSSDYWHTKVKVSLRETRSSRLGYRLQGCRQPSSTGGWHERTDQTDRTGNSWIVAKNADILDENKPTRPVFRAFFISFKSCSPVNKYNNDDNILKDGIILKNKNRNEKIMPVGCIELAFSWETPLIFFFFDIVHSNFSSLVD